MSAKRLGAFTGEFEEHALGLGDVLESVRLVETRGPIIDGVYDEGPGPQFHADAERPNDGVMKQATAQTVALEPSVDPQHAQQNHGHPFWDVPLEPSARYARTLHGMGAERVESGELAGFGIGDIRDGGALPLGVPRTKRQPIVDERDAAVEPVEHVAGLDSAWCGEFHRLC